MRSGNGTRARPREIPAVPNPRAPLGAGNIALAAPQYSPEGTALAPSGTALAPSGDSQRGPRGHYNQGRHTRDITPRMSQPGMSHQRCHTQGCHTRDVTPRGIIPRDVTPREISTQGCHTRDVTPGRSHSGISHPGTSPPSPKEPLGPATLLLHLAHLLCGTLNSCLLEHCYSLKSAISYL